MKTNLRLLVLFVAMIVIGLPIYFGFTWISTGNLRITISLTFYYFLIMFISTISIGIFNVLGIRAAEEAADLLENWLSVLIIGFRTNYLEYLYNKYRVFDTRGLTVQADYNLDLENVYVALRLSPLGSDGEELGKTIWEYISDTKVNPPKNYVIIGAPGSGKTTLLKQITLALSKPRKYNSKTPNLPKKLPVFVTIREHTQKIKEFPNYSLIDVLRFTVLKLGKNNHMNWFQSQLQKGNCIILIDGLDEVADPLERFKVTEWVQEQITLFNKNQFLITSRPYGYKGNALHSVDLLEVKPFTLQQIRQFIHNWYLANEIIRSQRDDQGIRERAEESAEDLIRRINLRPALAKIAINPLLATMIATVHSFKVTLPGRRVELYGDIFDVFLRRRIEIWQDVQLSQVQILGILKLLAYHMMSNTIQEIEQEKAIEVIQKELKSTGSNIKGEIFLKNIWEQSGLLLEKQNGVYAFSHLTFQEYLAATYILDDKTGELQKSLINQIGNSWWAETTLLYTAQTDATPIVSACLQEDPPKASALSLAIDCVAEAYKLEPLLREKFERIIDQSIESTKQEPRKLAGNAKLSSRLRWMTQIQDRVSIDNDLVTHVEYQIFLDELQNLGEYYFPDHWIENKFPDGHGKDPVLGIRPTDAQRFCEWLTQRDIWQSRYRIPQESENEAHPLQIKGDWSYWATKENNVVLQTKNTMSSQYTIEQSTLIKQIENDIEILNNINEAIKRRNAPKRTTEQLLPPYTPVADNQTTKNIKSGTSGKEYQIEADMRTIYESNMQLKFYESYSSHLGLEFEQVVNFASFIFLGKREDVAKATSWLSAVKPMYFLMNYDLKKKLQTPYNIYQSTRNNFGTTNTVIAENIDRSLSLLSLRTWNGVVIKNELNRKEVYEFLRWYTRLCALYLGYNFSKKDEYHKEMSRQFENILATLTFLEQRIIGFRSAFEGIRLVKIQT